MFAVVRFIEDGSTSEVPASWLDSSNNKCWWPPSRNVGFFIRSLATPNESTWTQHNIVVETFCDSIEVARKKAEDGNYTESEENRAGTRKKRLCKKKSMVDYVLNNSDSDEELKKRTLPAPPKFPGHKEIEAVISSCCETQKRIPLTQNSFLNMVPQIPPVYTESQETENGAALANTDSEESNEVSSVILDHNKADEINEDVRPNNDLSFDLRTLMGPDCQEQNELDPLSRGTRFILPMTDTDLALDVKTLPKSPTMRLLLRILKVTTELSMQMKQLLSTQQVPLGSNKSVDFEPIIRNLPITEEETLNQFEKNIENVKTKTIFKNYLSLIGGNSAKDMIFRTCKKMFREEFAVKCSWLGV